jgi:hypothetical protein
MKSMNDFHVAIDHEFAGIDQISSLRGYQIDRDDGIKCHCNLHQLKSVDYYYGYQGKHYKLEFTDLLSQLKQKEAICEELKAAMGSCKARTNILKMVMNSIHQEIVTKFKDTLHISRALHKNLTDVPQEIHECKMKLIVVTKPMNQEHLSTQQELVKFFEYVKDSLRNSIPHEMFHGVEVIPLDLFQSKYA